MRCFSQPQRMVTKLADMPLRDHLGITVEDVPAAIVQFDPVLTALGYAMETGGGNCAAWDRPGETELIIIPPARERGTGPHRHGRVGWQHLAFDVSSPRYPCGKVVQGLTRAVRPSNSTTSPSCSCRPRRRSTSSLTRT